jgi:hypothetical protein
VTIKESKSVISPLCPLGCAVIAARLASYIHGRTSLLPRPNPLITGPDNRTGKGGSGPASGPATGSRGLLEPMADSVWWGYGKVWIVTDRSADSFVLVCTDCVI